MLAHGNKQHGNLYADADYRLCVGIPALGTKKSPLENTFYFLQSQPFVVAHIETVIIMIILFKIMAITLFFSC